MAIKNKSKRVDVSDPIAAARLEIANQRAAAVQAAQLAERRAGTVQGLAQAAAGGGQLPDVGGRPGYQNPETGRYTGMLMRGISRPAEVRAASALDNLKLFNKPFYQKNLKRLKGAGYAGGIGTGYAGGIGRGGPEQPASGYSGKIF